MVHATNSILCTQLCWEHYECTAWQQTHHHDSRRPICDKTKASWSEFTDCSSVKLDSMHLLLDCLNTSTSRAGVFFYQQSNYGQMPYCLQHPHVILVPVLRHWIDFWMFHCQILLCNCQSINWRKLILLSRERDNARNNARCTKARKATHSLDGRHQDVDRTLRGRVNQNDRGQG